MFCKNCGKELPDDAKFCMSCGESLTGEFTNDFSESQSQSTDYYALVLLSFISHYAKIKKAIMSILNCTSKYADRALLSIRDNRNKGLVVYSDKQLDIIKSYAAPFQELTCFMKIFKINDRQTVSNGTIVDLNPSEDNISGQFFPKCPVCGSTWMRQIELKDRRYMKSGLNVAASTQGKSMICDNCGFTI